MFYIAGCGYRGSQQTIAWLKEAEILAVFHLHSLHSCPAGEQFGEFRGEDRYTTQEERASGTPAAVCIICLEVNQRTVINSLLSYFS